MAGSPYSLFLDIQTVQTKDFQYRGIPRYVCGHAVTLDNRGAVAALGLNPLQPYPQNLDVQIAASPRLTWSTSAEYRRLSTTPLAYHVMSPFETVPDSTMVPPFLEPRTPLVVTLYDLIPLLDPATYLARPDTDRRYRRRLEILRQADLLLTISKSTRADALRLLDLDPDRVHSIGSGVSGYFRPPASGEQPEKLVREELPAITRPFVLCVAGADERKNVDRLIQAYAALPEPLRRDLQLVVTCQLNDEWRQRWRDRAADNGLAAGELVLTELIRDDVLRALYQSARLKVFPSTYEGFGLPAAEAATCGCPTICSNTSSMPEILDLPEATFDPLDPEEIASTMHRALTDSEFDSRLRAAAAQAARRHTWEAVADRTIEALGFLPPPVAAPAGAPPARLRLALAGPFPPLRSGIADYNLRLARSLAEVCDLDLLLTPGSDPSTLPYGTRAFPLEDLGAGLNPGAYDCIIYTFGNSDHHHLTLDKAAAHPGVIWFHDLRLSGLYISYGVARAGPAGVGRFLADKLDYFYRSRLPASLAAAPSFEMQTYDHLGMGMTVELAQDARGAIVNSAFGKHLLELDQGPLMTPPATAVIPLAIPGPPAGYTEAREELTFGTFGIGGMHKAPDLLIEALALLRNRMAARLVFAGPCEQGLRRDLEQTAARLRVADAVTFTGELDEAGYWEWLGRVSCAVQVRRSTHGESSAALNDCLATGTPVITNLVACREMAEGVVEQLPADFGAAELAASLEVLLGDPGRRRAYARAGREWAAAHSFDAAAARVVKFVEVLESRSRDARQLIPR